MIADQILQAIATVGGCLQLSHQLPVATQAARSLSTSIPSSAIQVRVKLPTPELLVRKIQGCERPLPH